MRKTYAFAKAVPYVDDRCEVGKTFYNFCRIHKALRCTPEPIDDDIIDDEAPQQTPAKPPEKKP